MTDCLECTKKAKERNRLFDEIRVQAKQQANDEQETKVICKKTKQGEFFISTAGEAIEQKYIVVDVVSYLQ